MLSQRLKSIVFLVGLLLTIATSVQGAKQLCEEAPNFETLVHPHIKKIESNFQEAKHKAEQLIAEKKKYESPSLDELEAETHNFINNYQVMIQLMEQKASMCERLIAELDGLINFFVSNTLKRFELTATTPKP